MPLARIISHSHVCARELAIDLLARGYRVEIVSPDRIPDNFADLELRVDAVPGDQLVGSVEARNGNRSASLDFVHHLKAPMMDFIRRPLQPAAVDPGHGSHAEPGIPAKEPLTLAQQPAAKPDPPEVKIPPGSPLNSQQGAHPIPLSAPLSDKLNDQVPAVPIRGSSQPVAASTIGQSPLRQSPIQYPTAALQTKSHPKGSVWRPVLVLGGIAILALSLWIGARPSRKAAASAAVPAQAPTQVIAAAAPANSSSEPPATAALSEHAASNHATNLSLAHGSVAIAKLRLLARQRISREPGDDYVAPDTVVYFDKQTADEAAARAKLARRSKRHYATASNSRSGVIAANSVTYFNNKPTPKTTKQEATVTPVPDPN
jgi:hypothetical protein